MVANALLRALLMRLDITFTCSIASVSETISGELFFRDVRVTMSTRDLISRLNGTGRGSRRPGMKVPAANEQILPSRASGLVHANQLSTPKTGIFLLTNIGMRGCTC